MAYIYDLADTWANAAVTFTGIKLNVTDTASAVASNLMDLQVGGASRFSVRKDGRATSTAVSINGPYGGDGSWWSANFLNVAGSAALSFGAADVVLRRDAANTLAQRNGVNAQAFNIYNTYTDASNYERGVMKWGSNILSIGGEAAGTGAARDVVFMRGGSNFFRLNNNFEVAFETNRRLNMNNGWITFAETTGVPAAPANGVRIYAEDDGAGKTRLMALFATGAAVQLAIEP
jgi:hypothetical protein